MATFARQTSAIAFLTILLLNLVLINDQITPAVASKKKIMKKIMKILPLLSMFKTKKKIILLPIPLPINKPMMMNMDPGPMNMDMGNAWMGGGGMMMGGGD